jgi:CheY-like chemotaxis protein
MRALAMGFQMHLTKPVEPAELILVISTITHAMPLKEA